MKKDKPSTGANMPLPDVSKSCQILVDGQVIGYTTPTTIEIEPPRWELYMRRGNRVYFKNRRDGVKSMLELDPMPKEVREMKYGTVVNMQADGNFC